MLYEVITSDALVQRSGLPGVHLLRVHRSRLRHDRHPDCGQRAVYRGARHHVRGAGLSCLRLRHMQRAVRWRHPGRAQRAVYWRLQPVVQYADMPDAA